MHRSQTETIYKAQLVRELPSGLVLGFCCTYVIINLLVTSDPSFGDSYILQVMTTGHITKALDIPQQEESVLGSWSHRFLHAHLSLPDP